MEKDNKQQVLEILSKHASDDYLAGYFNGYNAAKEKDAKENHPTQPDKKPA